MNKRIKIFSWILLSIIVIVLIFILIGRNNKLDLQDNQNNTNILFEKDEGWGPCPSNLVCNRKTTVYYSGELILEGQVELQKQLNQEAINNLVRVIKSTNVMNKDCPAPMVLDYWATYKLIIDDKEKVINFPGCENELREIEKLISVNIPERQGGV